MRATQEARTVCGERGMRAHRRHLIRPVEPAQNKVARAQRRVFCALIEALPPELGLRPVSYTHLTLPTICSV